MYDVKEKVAIVTGGASGIGLATVKDLLAKEAKVVIADFNEATLKAAEEELTAKYGEKVSAYKVDVSDREQVKALVAFTTEKYGRLDIMVASAGIAIPDKAFEDNYYDKTVAINQNGVYYCAAEAAKIMIEQGEGGAIVNVSSILGLVSDAMNFSYTASKWAVRGMTKNMALALAPHNIRVNSIHPGAVMSGIVNEETMGKEGIQYFMSSHPLCAGLGRIGVPEEISAAIMLAIENTFMTGSELVIDGGYTVP